MKVYANVMVQNEALILPKVYEYWQHYPIDKWVFYDDNSSDDTVSTIKSLFGDKAKVFEGKDSNFSESRNRSCMLEFSRNDNADFVLSIDADELLSTSWLDNWDQILEQNKHFDIEYFWFNVVGSIQKFRRDRMYLNNFRTFLLPLKNTERFDMSQYKYHTPRTPQVSLPKARCVDAGVIHLQAINVRYYALKQLWYKHYEFVTWNHPESYINIRYDIVVNNLNFMEADVPEHINRGISFDPKIYDEIERVKGYKDYVLKHYNPDLVTFGKEYLNI